jgi:hypothetical protein
MKLNIVENDSPRSLIIPVSAQFCELFYVSKVSSRGQIVVFEAGGNGWADPDLSHKNNKH